MSEVRTESCTASPSELLAALREASRVARDVARVEPSALSGPQAASLAEEAAKLSKTAAAISSFCARRVEETGAHRDRGFPDARGWLSKVSGESRAKANAVLSDAEELEAHRATRAAMAQGACSPTQARAVMDGAEGDEHIERELLEIAQRHPLSRLRDEARKRREARDTPERRYARQRQRRELVHWKDRDGMVAGRFRLTPEVGAAVIERLEREADRRYRAASRPDRHRSSHAAFLADALAGLVAGGTGTTSRSSRTDVVVTIDWRALLRGHAHEGEVCQVVGPGPIPVPGRRRPGGERRGDQPHQPGLALWARAPGQDRGGPPGRPVEPERPAGEPP